MGVLTIKQALYLALAIVVLAIGGCLYFKGGAKPRAEAKAAKAEIKAVGESNKISRDTQTSVEQQGAETRERTQQAQEDIRERIQADPVVSGSADPDILRIAQEAHQRAIRAACRVQRTSRCGDPAAATE